MRKAQEIFRKYIDLESKSVYWYNPLTENSFWSKPHILRTLDCGFPTLMPLRDEEFVVLCSVCYDKKSVLFCHGCDDSMCEKCFTVNHKGKYGEDVINSTAWMSLQWVQRGPRRSSIARSPRLGWQVPN